MFYQVFRIFFKEDKKSHSVEYFDTYNDAEKRYYNVIASDIANDEITYNSAYIVNSDGLMLDGKVFDRRPQPEPEPEV